jgi:hypothetical protein
MEQIHLDGWVSPRVSTILKIARLEFLCAFMVLCLPATEAGAVDFHLQRWSQNPKCALWDHQASELMARRVAASSPGDVDLRQIGDSIFRMRRARRSCEVGQIELACQGYAAIMRNVPGISGEWRGYGISLYRGCSQPAINPPRCCRIVRLVVLGARPTATMLHMNG